ncbi:MAG: TetR/AcrR family transcriptional regulator [Candidatus Dadabacteria bacterium]|nr:MAG: TetR/AcrR family transcriptional regulator [Candidatus Dadabacteria bacterium]
MDKPEPSRRRTQAERRARARRQILDAALRCFETRGYQQTSMSRIAREAGVSKGLLHYHFQNKETLALAVWERVANDIFERFAVLSDAFEPNRASVTKLADALWKELQRYESLAPITLELVARAAHDEAAAEQVRELLAIYRRYLESGIEMLLKPQQSGLRFDARTIAELFMIVAGGSITGTMLGEDDAQRERLYRILRDTILDQLFATAPEGGTSNE